MPSRALDQFAEAGKRCGCQPGLGERGGLSGGGFARRSEGLPAEDRTGMNRFAAVEALLLATHIVGDEQAAERPFRHNVAEQDATEEAIADAAAQVVMEQRRLRRREGQLAQEGTGAPARPAGRPRFATQQRQTETHRFAIAAEAL